MSMLTASDHTLPGPQQPALENTDHTSPQQSPSGAMVMARLQLPPPLLPQQTRPLSPRQIRHPQDTSFSQLPQVDTPLLPQQTQQLVSSHKIRCPQDTSLFQLPLLIKQPPLLVSLRRPQDTSLSLAARLSCQPALATPNLTTRHHWRDTHRLINRPLATPTLLNSPQRQRPLPSSHLTRRPQPSPATLLQVPQPLLATNRHSWVHQLNTTTEAKLLQMKQIIHIKYSSSERYAPSPTSTAPVVQYRLLKAARFDSNASCNHRMLSRARWRAEAQ